MNRDVQMEIEGSLLERLLDRAMARGAVFAEARRLGPRKIRVSADEASARLLLSMCEKYGLNCRVLSRGGRAALRDTVRKRWTILPGILLAALLCWGFLTRLWWIDISFTGAMAGLGNEKQIRACLEAEGLRAGMAAGKIDTDLLQKRLMAGSGDYSFIGVTRQGVRLLVEAAPEVPSPELYARSYARDLVAARDGVVVSVNAKSGAAAVKAGDTVRRGQTLIRGEEAVGKDSETGEEITTPVSALGEVTARCWFEGGAVGSLSESVTRRTGNTHDSCRLKLMDFSLPITECEGFSSEEIETELLPVVGLFLPLEIERSIHHETITESVDIGAEALAAKLGPLARAEALAKISAAGIPDGEFTFWEERTQQDGFLRVRAVYEINTDIAVTREALQAQIEEVY